MSFEFKHFSELSLNELYEILKLRAEIFVVEQNCVYNDLDNLDTNAVHQFLRKNGEIVAYSRLLKPGSRFSDIQLAEWLLNSRNVEQAWYRNDGRSQKISVDHLECSEN